MIKNVVFDFGQVLVHFEPEYMTGRYIKNKEDVELVKDIVFDRLYWDRLDEGTISDKEVIERVCSRLPDRLHEAATKIYDNWLYNLPEIEGMRELVSYIKERYGVKTFILSNISKTFAEHSDEIPIIEEIDNCVFSAICGFVKPSREIFEHLCTKYSLLPEETVFIDDSEKNCEGAENFGIRTFLFKKNVNELKLWFDDILSRK